MNLPSLLDKAIVIARRDVLTAVRYRRALWLQMGRLLLEVAGPFFLARAVGPAFRPDGIGYYEFLLAGTAFFGFLLTVAYSMVSTVQEAQVTGAMEILMTTPTPGLVTVLLTAFSELLSSLAWLMVTLAAGLILFGVHLPHANWGAAIAVLVLATLACAPIGVLAAALQVTIQRGSIIVGLLGSLGTLLSGTMFPVSVLPPPLRATSSLLPFTHALTGLRMALFQGDDALLLRSMEALALFALVLLPLSVLVFSLALRRARLEGTLSFY
ncbi:MAG: ABC transporter permease [Terriglobales bacterium]